jgi:hypothetical protein
MHVFLIGLLLSTLAIPASAERKDAVLLQDYKGSYKNEFLANFDRVRLLVKQAQIEVSSRLGLIQYREGYRYPMTVRFDDGAPAGLEHSLAYVRYAQRGEAFEQEMVVCLDELSRHPTDFDTVFYHEMTHAVLNDAVGGEATFRVPRWLQEGLALYVSDDGDKRVRSATERLRKSLAHTLVFDLNGPVYGNAYPQYYLAIKYLLDKHSINAVQGLVRELIAGKTMEAALESSSGLSWSQFEKNVKAYSLKTFQDLAVPDHVSR